MPMPIEAYLQLSQWLSPAFPVSGYAYSAGLETAVAQGEVPDAHGVAAWLAVTLAAGSARSDAILLCLALRQALPDAELADLARALAPSAERWRESAEQGRALAETLGAMGISVPVAAYPVVLGIAARPLALPRAQVAGLFLQAQVSALVSAAVRLVPLGQAAGQRLIDEARAQVLAVAQEVADAGPDALGQASLGADMAAMRHETQEVRLFRS